MNLQTVCPQTVKSMVRCDIDITLRLELAAKDGSLQLQDGISLPWIAPLRSLITAKPSAEWTLKHQAMLRARVADGLWSPQRAVETGVACLENDDGVCRVCGAPCTQAHRDFSCMARDHFRLQYGMPSYFWNAHKDFPEHPLWSRCLVADPTQSLSLDTDISPQWTVAQNPSAPHFTGNAFGDGSKVDLCGHLTGRAAYAIVQISWNGSRSRVVNCLLGPLPGVVQQVPPAELFALVQFLRHSVDDIALVYYSDCESVVEGTQKGAHMTAQACHVHADLWRLFWDEQDKRRVQVGVVKVKAHQKKDLSQLTAEEIFQREGNGHADAGAKAALEMHLIDKAQVNRCRAEWAAVQTTAKYLARIQVETARAADDYIDLDKRKIAAARRKKAKDKARTKKSEKLTKLAPVPAPRGVRCMWCHRRAQDGDSLDRFPCRHAPAHVLWQAGPLIMCRRCGAYSDMRTRDLGRQCYGAPEV